MTRRLWPWLLGVFACGWAGISFDWRIIGASLLTFNLTHFLLIGVPTTFAVFTLRSLRWAAVAGVPFTPRMIWQTHLQTALAIATATATPLQAGEVLKLKLAHDTTNADYASLGAAFAIERLADAAMLFGLGVLGLGLRGASGLWLLALIPALAALVALAPFGLRQLPAAPLPKRLRQILQPLSHYRPTAGRMILLGACTVGKWFGVVLLWQATLASAGITLGMTQCALIVALVTLSVTISLVPGGIGVAEISARTLLVWLGVEPSLADSGAVMLRLLMPLSIAIGLLHVLAMTPNRKGTVHG